MEFAQHPGQSDDLLRRYPALSEALGRLVSAYEPERVFLFGSFARGDAHADSDFDLLLIVPDDAEAERLGGKLAYRVLRGTGIAADIVIWRRSRFEMRSRVATSLPATVLREGRLLYVA